MNRQWSSLGHVSSSSCNQSGLAVACSVTNTNRIPPTRSCLGSLQFLSCKQQVFTLYGGVNGPQKISLCKTHPRQNTINFLRRRKSDFLQLKSGQGTESEVSEDHNTDADKVEKPTKRLSSNERQSQLRKRNTLKNNDDRLPSDSWLPGKLFVEQKEGEAEATPADLLSSSLQSSSDPDSEEHFAFDGHSDAKHSSWGETSSICEERVHESELTGDAERGGGVMDDYDSEPLLDNDQEVEYVTRIMVPRQRYIRIPKRELVNALSVFSDQHEAKLSSVCALLELVLHAKHKFMLEELRADYRATQSTSGGGGPDLLKVNSTVAAIAPEKTTRSQRPTGELYLVSTGEQAQRPHSDAPDAEPDNDPTKTDNALTQEKVPKWKVWGMNFLNLLKQRKKAELVNDCEGEFSTESNYHEDARTASAKRFQKNFLRLLKSAQFEGLSAQDLELTAALNSDYLLTLPVAVDWKRASKSNAIIYRRGYAKEEQKGLLLGAKFDYLQSAFLRETLKGLTGPLISTGRWFMRKWKSLRNDPEGRVLAETVERWVEEPLQSDEERPAQDTLEGLAREENEQTENFEMDLPLWKAAQQAVPRYEAVLSSAGSRGLLLRRILISMGLLPSDSVPAKFSVDEASLAVEPHLRPDFLSRISMKDIWLPASRAAVGKNVWKRFRAALSVFLTQVTLQEPAFQELVLLYYDDYEEHSGASGLQLQMYKTIPLPDLKIVFPSKQLSFRLIDTVRLDLTTFVGLTAFLYNYHFEAFLSSPSAFTLDVIAASALSVFVARAALSYKQTWDRYELLVNKSLYEKTLANGFGVIHFLMDASEEQQFKEAIVAFSVLSHRSKDEGMSREQLADACERFLYYRCKEQTEMPVDSAIKNLLDLGLVYRCENISSPSQRDSEVRYRAMRYNEGLQALKQYWESIPSKVSSSIA